MVDFQGAATEGDYFLKGPQEIGLGEGDTTAFWACCYLLIPVSVQNQPPAKFLFGVGHWKSLLKTRSGALGPIGEGRKSLKISVHPCAYSGTACLVFTLCLKVAAPRPFVCLSGLSPACGQRRIKCAAAFAENNSETQNPPTAPLLFFQCFPTRAK